MQVAPSLRVYSLQALGSEAWWTVNETGINWHQIAPDSQPPTIWGQRNAPAELTGFHAARWLKKGVWLTHAIGQSKVSRREALEEIQAMAVPSITWHMTQACALRKVRSLCIV